MKANEFSKSEQIVDLILSYIIENKMQPGDKLPSEEELAERVGVSRVSVREGLRGLKFLGLLKSSTRRGTILQEMDFSILSRCLSFQIAVSKVSYRQLLEARLAVELGVLELVCGKLTPEQLAELQAVADCERRDNSTEEVERNYRLDAEFHRLLLQAGGNPILQAYSRLLEIFFSELRELSSPQVSREAAMEHRQLVEALTANNQELARGIMRHHLQKYNTLKEVQSCGK